MIVHYYYNHSKLDNPNSTEEGTNPNFKPEKGQPSPPRKKSNPYPREGRAKQPKRRKGQSPSQEWEGHICQYTLCYLLVMSLPILPKGVGSDLTLPFTLGSGLAPPFRIGPGPSPSFPFGWAPGLPILPFLAGPGLFLFWVGPWPTPNPKRANLQTQEKEGPTSKPERGRAKGQPQWPTATPTPRKDQPQLQAREAPTLTPRKKSNPYPREGRANPLPKSGQGIFINIYF